MFGKNRAKRARFELSVAQDASLQVLRPIVKKYEDDADLTVTAEQGILDAGTVERVAIAMGQTMGQLWKSRLPVIEKRKAAVTTHHVLMQAKKALMFTHYGAPDEAQATVRQARDALGKTIKMMLNTVFDIKDEEYT